MCPEGTCHLSDPVGIFLFTVSEISSIIQWDRVVCLHSALDAARAPCPATLLCLYISLPRSREPHMVSVCSHLHQSSYSTYSEYSVLIPSNASFYGSSVLLPAESPGLLLEVSFFHVWCSFLGIQIVLVPSQDLVQKSIRDLVSLSLLRDGKPVPRFSDFFYKIDWWNLPEFFSG